MSETTSSIPKTAPKKKPAPALSIEPDNILRHAQSSRAVIQGFVSLADSLEWQLGQEYLRQRGNKAFISDSSPVPFVINNDGTLSRNAAEVLFASLEARSAEGGARSAEGGARSAEGGARSAGDAIYVLELGIGVGLFARFFMDHFQALCARHGRDYYERLCYIAADKSEQMLRDVIRYGVLAGHPGRYRLRLVDAMEPDKELPHDVEWRGRGARASGESKPIFHAVFLNYLLDCLPAAVLEVDGDEVRQLYVRTLVARNINLKDHTDLTLEQLQERAAGKGPSAEASRRDLLEVYGLFASEYDYQVVRGQESGDRGRGTGVPYLEFALAYGRPLGKRLLHSYGAIQSLERLLGMVREDGFILLNDYGQTQVMREEEFEHQRFSLATFVGLNFRELRGYFGESGRCEWVEPHGEGGGIHSRLLLPLAAAGTKADWKSAATTADWKSAATTLPIRGAFLERFGEVAQARLQEPIGKARECHKVGRFELAANYYRQALEMQPGNWVLLNEVAMFLIFGLRDAKSGVDMARAALAQNPSCSSELWSTLGDGLFELGRAAEARSAYLRALQVNASGIRARYNLAWVHIREKNLAAAMEVIAQALVLDKTGEYRERLLQKQQEVLAQLTARHQREYLLLINLVSKYAKEAGKNAE